MVLQGQDAWRQHPVFRNLWRSAFPGFRLGAMAFGAFVVVETAYKLVSPAPAHGHHGGHHAVASEWARANPGALPGSAGDDDDDE